MKKAVLTIIIFIFTVFSINAVELDGFADCYSSVGIKKDNDFIGLRSRMRFNLSADNDRSYFYGSLNCVDNQVLSEKEITLQELYIGCSGELWDIRIGRQIYIWGKADGVRITDLICPADYTEYNTRDLDDVRMPVESVKMRYFLPSGEVEFIWIPLFKSSLYPEGKNPWTVAGIDDVVVNDPVEPEKKLENSEIAGKLSFYLSGFDFALSAFHTWDDEPVYRKIRRNGVLSLTPEYHRLESFGVELSKPFSDFVLRSETACLIGKYFASSDKSGVTEKNYIKSLAGLDWYGEGNVVILIQGGIDYIIDYEKTISNDEIVFYTTFNITKKLFRELLELKNMLYYDFNNEDGYNSVSAEYSLTDDFHFSLGVNNYFNTYEKNNMIWVKAKYSY